MDEQCMYSSFLDDPVFQPFCLKNGLTQQIVASDHRVDHHPPHDPLGDVRDFEHDVDVSLTGINRICVDPRVFFSQPSSQNPRSDTFTHHAQDEDAATISSLSSSNCSVATSPPTSPEYVAPEDVDGTLKADEPDLTVNPSDLSLDEEMLKQLIRFLNDNSPPDAGDLPADHGTPPNSLVEHNVPAPSYTPLASEKHEHSFPQHPNAVVAGAHDSGDGMRAPPTNTAIVDLGVDRDECPSPRGDSFTDADALAPAAGVVRRTATTRGALVRREQPATKKHFCDVPGCAYATTRSNNLKTHKAEKHLGRRPYPCPVASCPKALQPYCRSNEMRKHVASKHPGYTPPSCDTGPSNSTFGGHHTPLP
ncbi:hypothetical protein FKP32DRAFT_1588234 [Trametes sanguinea]|nr:hypothetical protein FKP32DRAFT_1588234 [Trametes sanguinea]